MHWLEDLDGSFLEAPPRPSWLRERVSALAPSDVGVGSGLVALVVCTGGGGGCGMSKTRSRGCRTVVMLGVFLIVTCREYRDAAAVHWTMLGSALDHVVVFGNVPAYAWHLFVPALPVPGGRSWFGAPKALQRGVLVLWYGDL